MPSGQRSPGPSAPAELKVDRQLSERLRSEQIPAVQRQSWLSRTGRLVGNRAIVSMLRVPRQTVQRVGNLTSVMALNLARTHKAIQDTLQNNDTLRTLDDDIDAVAAEKIDKSHFNEERGKGRDELIVEIGKFRGRVQSEVVATDLGIEEPIANGARQYFYRKLARLGPFYTQTANANILSTSKADAARRTCNVTCVSMALEGLGKTAADFTGDSTLIENIFSLLSLGGGSATGLRLPDYMQIVAIYIEMKRGTSPGKLNALFASDKDKFRAAMVAGAKEAANAILSSGNLKKYAKMFGVDASVHNLDLKQGLSILGAYYRPFESDLEDFAKEKLKKDKVSKSEIESVREAFTASRKKQYRGKGKRIGKEISNQDEAIAGFDDELSKANDTMAEYDAELASLAADIPNLEQQVADKTAAVEAADKSGKKALNKELNELTSSLKTKQKRQKKLNKKKPKLQDKISALEGDKTAAMNERAGLQLRQSAALAVGDEADEAGAVETALPTEAYKSSVYPLMFEILGSGKQVIVNLHNHFVKLQGVTADGFQIHDPGGRGQERINKSLTWEEGKKLGYFKRYTVVG